MEMFWVMPRILHSSRVNLDVKCGCLSLMILDGSPYLKITCRRYKAAVSSADISSWQGMNTAALVQSWSVTVRIESLPCDSGNLVIKSSAIVSNGSASGFGEMGCSGAFVGRLLIFCRWDSAHRWTNFITSLRIL